MRRALLIAAMVLGSLLFIVGLTVALATRWVFSTWPHLAMDQLMFTVNAPTAGANPQIIRSAVWAIVPGIVLALAGLVYGFHRFAGKHANNRQSAIAAVTATGLGLFTLLGSASYAWQRLSIQEFLDNRGLDSTFIHDNYVDPRQVAITFPEQKRNLIYIYLESGETTWASRVGGGILESSVIPKLENLALTNETFRGHSPFINGGYVLPGTTWTMGGMFAQSTGLPLITSIPGNAMSTQQEFFPGVRSIGNILQDVGYTNNLLIGSLAEFGGRGLFFTEHGNYSIWDYDYAHDNGLIPDGHFVFWGFEDRRKFEIAKTKTLELAAADQPFNLTMLTVDTHTPGWLDPGCEAIKGDLLSNAYLCNDKLVVEYISWLRQQPFWENTTVVLSGDHLSMAGNFGGGIPEEYSRRTFTTIINAPVDPECPAETRTYSTLDMFPTTLAALGAEIPGDKLALGTNLYGCTPTLLEEFGFDYVAEQFQIRSTFMDVLAGPLLLPTYVLAGNALPNQAQIIFSPNREFYLETTARGDARILQGTPEGLAVTYHTDTETETDGHWLNFTYDGNLEIRNNAGQVVKESNTAGRGSRLELRDDGNLVIVDSRGNDIWSVFGEPGGEPLFVRFIPEEYRD